MVHEDRTCLIIGMKMTEIGNKEYEMMKYKTWVALISAFQGTDPLRRTTEHIDDLFYKGLFNDQ